jgi:Kef-type K+ transport system membrane component KefB
MDEHFLRDLGIIIVAACLFAVLARRLRLPTIVAYLLAGLTIGPWLGLVKISHTLQLISEVGIILLLFLVGLELSLDKIKGVGRAVLMAGLVQIILTALGGFALSQILGYAMIESVFIAFILTFSSTVVAVKLLEAWPK